MKGKIFIGLVLIYLVTAAGHGGGLFKAVEDWSLNHRFFLKYWLTHQVVEEQIVIIGIDDYSIDQLGKWPWSRSIHAHLLATLKEAGAAVVGFDITFDEPSNPRADAELAAALTTIKTVLPLQLDLEIYRSFGTDKIAVNQVKPPLALFSEKADLGHINLIAGYDGVIRQAYPVLNGQPSFALSLARSYDKSKKYLDKPFYIHFSGPSNSFRIFSYADILADRYPFQAFRGKIVLVGAISPALGDQFVTPFATFGLMSGVEIHAHQVNTLLTGKYIRPLRLPYVLLLQAAFALLYGYITFKWKPSWKLVSFGGLSVGYYLYSIYIFLQSGLVLPFAPIGLVLVGYLLTGILFAYYESDAEKKKLYETFHRYLAPQVLKQIEARSAEIKYGGEQKMAAVMFIDIRGFTPFTHAHEPEEVVDLLNKYLQLFAEVIFSYEGTLDKYLGDGLMSVFGAPVEGEDDLKRALAAAMTIREKVVQAGLPLPVGIGLAYGPVISGNIGSEKRLDYTVIGDTVNTASRLEGIARPGEIVLNEKAAKILNLDAVKEEVQLKGIGGKTTVYRLLRRGDGS